MKWFSFSTTPDLIIIYILGLKLKFKRLIDRRKYAKFMNHVIKPRTILIVELNNCHFETIPGFAKYLIDLGYNVDILTRFYSNRAFDALNFNNALQVFEANEATFDKIVNNYNFGRYERIFYNSKRIYKRIRFKQREGGIDVAEYFKVVPRGIKDNIYVQHHIDKFYDRQEPNQIILANPAKLATLAKHVVNPHYFGEFKIKTVKNQDIVNFISIGNITNARRNTNLAIEAAKQLLDLGYHNFKLTIIGRGKLDHIDPLVKQHLEILGRVDYQSLFKALTRADFILPLLDPIIKEHQRYQNAATSGTFQLVYGFLKPHVIHQTFAAVFNFSADNSVIYRDNAELASAMIRCMQMPQEAYLAKQQALNQLVQAIEKESIDNLLGMLGHY